LSDTNSVVLVGRLTRDAELKYTNGGTAVTKFSVAVNERRKKGETWEDEVNFFDVTLWGKTAEAVTKYLTKGKQVALSGKLHQERWEKEGQQHSKVAVTAFTVQLLGGGKQEGGQRPEGPAPDNFEDDIPFA